MLEIRLLDSNKAAIPTLEDVTIPRLVTGAAVPSWIVLADYCFNNEGPFLVWKQNLDAHQVAAASFDKQGKLNSLIVQEKKIEDIDQRETYMKYLASNCLMTKYSVPARRGEEIFLFYIPPYRQYEVDNLLSKPVKTRVVRKNLK